MPSDVIAQPCARAARATSPELLGVDCAATRAETEFDAKFQQMRRRVQAFSLFVAINLRTWLILHRDNLKNTCHLATEKTSIRLRAMNFDRGSLGHLRLGILFLGIWVCSCSPVYETQYRFQQPESAAGRQCAGRCLDNGALCQQNCRLDFENCRRQERALAVTRYDEYVYAQNQVGKDIEKSVADFEFLYRCDRSTACDDSCDSDHRICHSNCGGSVNTESVCTRFCDD
jgi:hypothetical protein